MYVLKWANLSTRMFFAPDDGGGSASAPSSSSSGGDGGGSSVAATSSDGGGSSSPSAPSSPDSGSPAAPSAPAAEPMPDWGALGSLDDLDTPSNVVPPAPTPAAAPVPPVAPVAPAPATPPQAPQVPPVAPAPAATPQTQPDPAAAAPPSPQLSPSDPLGIAVALEQNRDVAIAHLASTKFALSQADVDELEADAATFIPKMMGRVLHESQVSMMKFLAQAVPGMVKQFNTVSTANTKAEDQFFEAHKGLGLDPKNDQHRQTAFRMAKMYRQANPDMPMEQLIAEVGPIVAASLRLPLLPGSASAPAAPAVPVIPRSAAPFRPAVGGGGGAPPTPAPADEWSGMGQNFD